MSGDCAIIAHEYKTQHVSFSKTVETHVTRAASTLFQIHTFCLQGVGRCSKCTYQSNTSLKNHIPPKVNAFHPVSVSTVVKALPYMVSKPAIHNYALWYELAWGHTGC